MAYLIHPDDVESPRFGNWADNFNTYDDACRYYGVDTPAQIEAENAYYDQLGWIQEQDDMEARGGPLYDAYRSARPWSLDDDCPF